MKYMKAYDVIAHEPQSIAALTQRKAGSMQ